MGTLAPANSQIEDTFLIKKKIDIKFWLFLKPKINPLTPFLIKRREMTIWVGGPDFSPEDVKHKISSSIVS